MQERQQKLVLVVDDDDSIRQLLVTALQARGYTARQAAGGVEAAEILGCPARPPDLLVCDVNMPTIDGFSLVRLLRARDEFRKIPVIFLTACIRPAEVVQGLSLGARQYIQKPFALDYVMSMVDRILR